MLNDDVKKLTHEEFLNKYPFSKGMNKNQLCGLVNFVMMCLVEISLGTNHLDQRPKIEEFLMDSRNQLSSK